MVISNPYQTYQNNAVTTASPGELTLMLYNGCLKFIKLAGKAIEDGNMEEKNINLQKVQNIISEFMVTLNMDYEVSKNLMSLYDYINRRIVEVNIKNNPEILKEIEGYIVELRDTWKEAIIINRQRQHVQGGRA